MIRLVLLAALGGALGSAARAAVGLAVAAPWGTLAVNLVGGFAIGLLAARLAPGGAWAFAVTGVLGGFTTFSAFSLDVMRLIETGRIATAATYAGLSVAGAIVACAAGLALGRLA